MHLGDPCTAAVRAEEAASCLASHAEEVGYDRYNIKIMRSARTDKIKSSKQFFEKYMLLRNIIYLL